MTTEKPTAPGWAQGEVALAMVLAGSTVTVGKLLTGHLPVFMTMALSMTCATLTVLPWLVKQRRRLLTLTGQEWWSVARQAIFGVVLFRALLLVGLRHTSSFRAGIVMGTGPAVMALVARVALREQPPGRGMLAILLAVGGLMTLGAQPTASEGSLFGDALVLGAVVCETLLTVFRKRCTAGLDALTNTALISLIALGLSLPLWFVEMALQGPPQLSGTATGLLIYYGVIGTVVAYWLWADGAPRIAAWQTGLALGLPPLSAMLLSFLLLAEQPSPLEWLGAAAVLLAIATGVWASRARAAEPLSAQPSVSP